MLPARSLNPKLVLQQSTQWSRMILWSIVGLVSFTTVWASVTQIEEAISAIGKLEPQGTVKEVQAPVNGVVREILVKDGDSVKKGEVLIRFDTTAAQAQVESQEKIREKLIQEIAFYRGQLAGGDRPELGALARTRDAITSENQMLQAQVQGTPTGALSSNQEQQRQAWQASLDAQINQSRLKSAQVEQQLQQGEAQLVEARSNLASNQRILDRFNQYRRDGIIPTVQLEKQEQEVLKYRSQIAQLTQEQQRLQLEIGKSKQEEENIDATAKQRAFAQMTNNAKSLAEIDTQASKVILENEKKVAEIDAQLRQAKLTLQYQELRAPVDGTIFELKPTSPGFVANSSSSVLKIVPTDSLVAKVDIPNKDIGFIQRSLDQKLSAEGLEADIRIDAFPFREFGDVKGRLSWIGSDALPPDQIHPNYRFPAKIRLDGQKLQLNGREVPLRSGMSVSVNIKLRKRSVMSLFLDEVLQKVESLKLLR